MNQDLFAKRLRELRMARGYSQNFLSEISLINRTTINKYEKGERKPSIDNLITLARIFKVNVEYLCGISSKYFIEVDDYITYEKIVK